jgi:hypothetical protein
MLEKVKVGRQVANIVFWEGYAEGLFMRLGSWRLAFDHWLHNNLHPFYGNEEGLALLPSQFFNHLTRNGYSELTSKSLQPYDF